MGFQFSNHTNYPERILIRKFTNTVNLKVISESWQYIKENQLVTHKTKGIINYLRGCSIQLTMKEFTSLREFLNQQEVMQFIKLAVVTDSPQIIVFPFLLYTQETKIRVKPFSTYEAAETWILGR